MNDCLNSQINSTIAARFGNATSYYHKYAKTQKQCATFLIKFLETQQFQIPTGTILEIGCGTGFLTQEIVKRFPNWQFLITDLSPQMLQFCQKNLDITAQQRDYLVFQQLDGENMAELPGSYVLILSNFVIQWFNNPFKSLQQLYDRLQPGGVLAFSFPHQASFPEWKQICQELGLPYTANPLPELNSLISSFIPTAKNLTFSTEWMSEYCDDAYDFFRHLKSIGATVNRSQKQLSGNQLRKLIATWNQKTNDQVKISYHAAFIILQK